MIKNLDKDALREKLPLAYACETLGITLDAEGRALCPFHDDTTPSFQLRRDDDGVQRWACWPCGIGGDVFDIIQRVEAVSFPEAITRADLLYEGMGPNWAQKFELRSDKVAAETPEQWRAQIDAGLRRALLPDNDGMLCIVAGLVDEGLQMAQRRRIDRQLRDRWSWALDENNNILIPHLDLENKPRAIKVRALGGLKWSRSGSRYDVLYGIWHGQTRRSLLLCEGESDAVWADLQDPGIDVLALPSGANTIRDAYVQHALNYDDIFLAFDADNAGIKATRLWIEALDGRARVVRLPRGHDLRSARPDIHEILGEAIRPTPEPTAIQVGGGFFERIGQNGPRTLSSWYAEPTARLVSDEVDPAIEIELHYAGRTTVDIMTSSDMRTSSKLREWASKRSIDCLASDNDAQLLQSYLTARAQVLPDVFQTPRLGIHEPPERHRYAGKSLVLPDSYIGKLPWRYVGPPELADKVMLSNDGPINWDWLTSALELNHASVMHPIIAWLCATTRRQEVKQFPLLFIGGSSGAGKSTVAQLLCRMFGSELGAQLGAITAFPLMRLLSSSSSLPVFIDEWSRQSRSDTREAFQGNVPIIYEGGIAERGRADQTVTQYRCSSPILVAGEDAFSLDREVDRMCATQMPRVGQNFEALRVLTGQPLERFGYWFNSFVLEAEDLPQMPTPDYGTRPEYNANILRCGWQTLRQFVAYSGQYDERAPELPIEPDLSAMGAAEEEHENEYEDLISEALGGITDSDHNPLVWTDEGGTWVRFKALTSSDVLRRIDVSLPGGGQAMRRYFEHQGYVVESSRVQAPMSMRSVFASYIKGYFPREGDHASKQ